MLNLVKKTNEEVSQDIASLLSKKIGNPPENSRVITFTPQVAEWVLETYNDGNRPRKPANIKKYADDMKNNKWGLTGDTIKFSDAGRLRDGQNRMAACVRSGTSFTSHVIFGIEDALFHVMDTGKTRGASDVLAIAGFTNTTSLASALRWSYILDTDPNTRPGLSNEDALNFIRKDYADIEASMPVGKRLYSQYNHPIGQMAAMHRMFAKVDKTLADEFFDAWSSGVRAGRARCIGYLQDSLARVKDSNHGRIHDTIRSAMVVKGWNLYYTKRKGSPKACLMQVGEQFPKVEGA
ncbi:hypothetical protein N9878_00660 [bacterium]|nr:hypothetical protein [bacterium]